MTDEANSDETTEVEIEGTKVKVPRAPKANGATNGVHAVRAPSDAQLNAFGVAIATSGRELNVERVRGPNGRDTYARRPVQLGMLPNKLPPEASQNLVSALMEAAGGGWYKCWPDGAKANEVLWPIKVPGRPKPLDAAQAADENAEAEERELYGDEPLPTLGGGGYGRGAYGPLPPTAHEGYAMPPLRPGYTYDPVTRMQIPIAPFHDPRQSEMARENAELRRKVELDPITRELTDLREKAKQPVVQGDSPFKSMIEMLQLQYAEAEKERKHALSIAIEERKAKEAAEDRKAMAEKAAEDRREAREREERKEARTLEEARATRQAERDREDRIEREKTARDLMQTLVKITVEGKKAPTESPTQMLASLMGVVRDVKEINAPAGKSETAEIAEAVTHGSKEIIGAIGDAWGGRGNGATASENKPSPTTDEGLQLLEVMDFAGRLAKNKCDARTAYNTIAGFVHGRGYDFDKVCEKLRALNGLDDVKTLRETLQGKASLCPSSHRPALDEAVALLGIDEHAQWCLALGNEVRG